MNIVPTSLIPLLVPVIATKAPKIQVIFYSCPSYTVQRVILVNSVKEILLKVNLIHLEDQSKLYMVIHLSVHPGGDRGCG